MGLDDFKSETNEGYKKYGYHEYNDRLEQWADEYEQRFPADLNIDFIEVSPNMTKMWARAYRRPGGNYYIRFSESYVDRANEREIRFTLLHEMTHIYFYRKGYTNNNHDKYFRWVVGRVGGDMTNTTIHDRKWKDCIEPFLDDEV